MTMDTEETTESVNAPITLKSFPFPFAPSLFLVLSIEEEFPAAVHARKKNDAKVLRLLRSLIKSES
jgi:hypothetical protein